MELWERINSLYLYIRDNAERVKLGRGPRNEVLAGVIGDTMLYVSGGAEHQGPPGGGPVAIIAKI